MIDRDRQRGMLLGLAIGDALGAAVEFEVPGSFEPVQGYRGAYDHENYLAVRHAALYWHFLDLVWLVMFLTFWALG